MNLLRIFIIIFSSLYVDHLEEDKQEERNEGARQRKKGRTNTWIAVSDFQGM